MGEQQEVILTQEGFDKLEEELNYLKTEKRTEIAERIKVARGFGDLSENSEYDEAKNAQAENEQQIAELEAIYEKCGYPIVFTSALEQENIEEIRRLLLKKTTAIAGPSGVGKSSLINLLQNQVQMETGTISRKIERGKHTTRHSELIAVDADSYIMDTPGFSSLYVNDFEKEELKYYFREFASYEGQCRFQGCDHVHEPGCAVKEALEEGKIHPIRYKNYLEMYTELKEKKRY